MHHAKLLAFTLAYSIAKRHPAAAISQNQIGSSMSEEPLEDEPELEDDEPEEVDEEPEPEPELEEPPVAEAPEELVGEAVAATKAAAAALLTEASVDVRFMAKSVTLNVTLDVACQVSDPNWISPRKASVSIKLFLVK